MSVSTYATLKASIIDWSKRGDILSLVDDFIDLAESDMWTKLRIRDMETTTTGSVSARTLALPAGFQQMRRMRLISGGQSYDLEYVAPESLKIDATSGLPESFTVTSQIEFNRTPDSTYTYEIVHYASLTALSDSNTTNAILTRFPAIYLFGALMFCSMWAMDDASMQKWATMYQEAIDRANGGDRRGRHGPAPRMKVEGSTP